LRRKNTAEKTVVEKEKRTKVNSSGENPQLRKRTELEEPS
jgi:hypothetical protein